LAEFKPLIRNMVPAGIMALAQENDWPGFRTTQLNQWLHIQQILTWDGMSNFPRKIRTQLADEYDLVSLFPLEKLVSQDGTRKFLFQLRDGLTVESVTIPMADHATFCISTQVGCAMACSFCATARGGLKRNLEPAEIVEQVIRLTQELRENPIAGHGNQQFNIVYMGMGEPLDNWESTRDSVGLLTDKAGMGISRRRIQISTSGPEEGLLKLLANPLGVGLTLSIGGSDEAERKMVMPVPGRTTPERAVELVSKYARETGRRATLAWVLIEGKTDKPDQAARLARLVRNRPMKVNLIPLNPLDDGKDNPPSRTDILAFQKVLIDGGVDTFIRASGGRDIAAACGQLRRRRLQDLTD
jgi:23S rRNA (adenine2503-C2)-methyltransferase